jgi:hypothetical protein
MCALAVVVLRQRGDERDFLRPLRVPNVGDIRAAPGAGLLGPGVEVREVLVDGQVSDLARHDVAEPTGELELADALHIAARARQVPLDPTMLVGVAGERAVVAGAATLRGERSPVAGRALGGCRTRHARQGQY